MGRNYRKPILLEGVVAGGVIIIIFFFPTLNCNGAESPPLVHM